MAIASTLNRQYMDSATRLQTLLIDSPVGAVLPAICWKQQRFAIARLNLPNWWLAGGAVRNTVWRSLFSNDCQLIINDFDTLGDFWVNGELRLKKLPEH